MEDTTLIKESEERRADLVDKLVDTFNQHVFKYRSEIATKEMLFVMADVLGLYANVLGAPDEVMKDLHRLIDDNMDKDTGSLNIRRVDYQ